MSAAPSDRRPPPPIPVTILTGFLGAGKTTVLNRLLRDPALARSVVLINEFGEIGLDHLFVEKIDGDMVMMASGCLCCTLRGDLIDTLENLLRRLDNGRIPPFDRLVIETTGLADPAPILHTLMGHPYLLLRFRLDGLVTVLDAINGAATLETHPESLRQAAMADLLVFSKIDLIRSDEEKRAFARLLERLERINAGARRLDDPKLLDANHLLGLGLYNPETKATDVARWLNVEALAVATHGHGHHSEHESHDHDINRHGDSIRAFVLVGEKPLSPSSCDLFLEILRNAHGPNLLRVKGIIALTDDPSRPLVIHGVQHVFHPPTRLDAWPDADHRTRIVFIVHNTSPQFVQGLYDAFAGDLGIDRPDAQALTESPLTPARGGLLA
ncbi:CobW family GTP-binding protein [Rhodoblastus sp.]|uniref:CobW family GTP-binding protein n=1 Tax=Rhodoblastus sp. TaxID=1962975 RepID=UPI003F9BC7DC